MNAMLGRKQHSAIILFCRFTEKFRHHRDLGTFKKKKNGGDAFIHL